MALISDFHSKIKMHSSTVKYVQLNGNLVPELIHLYLCKSSLNLSIVVISALSH
jgi:hypothetical protein